MRPDAQNMPIALSLMLGGGASSGRSTASIDAEAIDISLRPCDRSSSSIMNQLLVECLSRKYYTVPVLPLEILSDSLERTCRSSPLCKTVSRPTLEMLQCPRKSCAPWLEPD